MEMTSVPTYMPPTRYSFSGMAAVSCVRYLAALQRACRFLDVARRRCDVPQ